MSPSKGIVYVLSGRRDLALLAESVRILRCFDSSIPIRVYHDGDLSLSQLGDPENVTLVKYTARDYSPTLATANSNRQRLVALLESPYDCTIYLDNDVFVVDPAFFDGFGIAQWFGLALPQNPRGFFFTRVGNLGDMEIGRGVTEYDRLSTADMPRHMLSFNTGLILYSPLSRPFLEAWLAQFDAYPSRGQAALCRTVWATKQVPVTLPSNWLVCRRDERIEFPITLHVGHDNIMARWKREFERWVFAAGQAGVPPDPSGRPPVRVSNRPWHRLARFGIRLLTKTLPKQ